MTQLAILLADQPTTWPDVAMALGAFLFMAFFFWVLFR